MSEIVNVVSNKKQYLELLLLADEQEDMIDLYIERGDMYALYDQKELRGVCVVTKEAEGVYELKNIATYEKYHGMGYGRQLVEFILEKYKEEGTIMYVGTGDSPLTVPFYEKCGFVYSHRIKNFFIDHYDHPIFECGKQLIDMVYMKKEI